MAALMTRAQWALRLSLRRLGWLRVAALAAILLAAGLLAHARFVIQPQLSAWQARRPASVERVQTAAPAFPPLSQTAILPGWLQQHAAGSGLTLSQTQYDLETVGKHSRYRAILPLQGSYPALRRFLAEALNRYPNLALESLQIRRDKTTDEILGMRLVLVFYLAGRP
jgi:hypothetical protein